MFRKQHLPPPECTRPQTNDVGPYIGNSSTALLFAAANVRRMGSGRTGQALHLGCGPATMRNIVCKLQAVFSVDGMVGFAAWPENGWNPAHTDVRHVIVAQ